MLAILSIKTFFFFSKLERFSGLAVFGHGVGGRRGTGPGMVEVGQWIGGCRVYD